MVIVWVTSDGKRHRGELEGTRGESMAVRDARGLLRMVPIASVREMWPPGKCGPPKKWRVPEIVLDNGRSV